GADLNVACDGPSGRGPWMGRVIRSQHISNLKYEGYRDPMIFIGSDIRVIVKGWCHSPTFFVRENLESRKELS
ncbi:hypothetical protein F9E03_16690, partial [Salmonella enterica]|nr:hypothetical protein [Salmonella enterica]